MILKVKVAIQIHLWLNIWKTVQDSGSATEKHQYEIAYSLSRLRMFEWGVA